MLESLGSLARHRRTEYGILLSRRFSNKFANSGTRREIRNTFGFQHLRINSNGARLFKLLYILKLIYVYIPTFDINIVIRGDYCTI